MVHLLWTVFVYYNSGPNFEMVVLILIDKKNKKKIANLTANIEL